MTLDPQRFDNYLSGNLTSRLVDVFAEWLTSTTALVVARLEQSREEDDCRMAHWQDSVAAQDRAISMSTRLQHNIVEQLECDVSQLAAERDLLYFLIDHTRGTS